MCRPLTRACSKGTCPPRLKPVASARPPMSPCGLRDRSIRTGGGLKPLWGLTLGESDPSSALRAPSPLAEGRRELTMPARANPLKPSLRAETRGEGGRRPGEERARLKLTPLRAEAGVYFLEPPTGGRPKQNAFRRPTLPCHPEPQEWPQVRAPWRRRTCAGGRAPRIAHPPGPSPPCFSLLRQSLRLRMTGERCPSNAFCLARVAGIRK
jgi:hypothetical protein